MDKGGDRQNMLRGRYCFPEPLAGGLSSLSWAPSLLQAPRTPSALSFSAARAGRGSPIPAPAAPHRFLPSSCSSSCKADSRFLRCRFFCDGVLGISSSSSL